MDFPFDEDDDFFAFPIGDDDAFEAGENFLEMVKSGIEEGQKDFIINPHRTSDVLVSALMEYYGMSGVYMLMSVIEDRAGIALEIITDKDAFENRVFNEASMYDPEIWAKAKSSQYWGVMLDDVQKTVDTWMSKIISAVTQGKMPFRARVRMAIKTLTKG